MMPVISGHENKIEVVLGRRTVVTDLKLFSL